MCDILFVGGGGGGGGSDIWYLSTTILGQVFGRLTSNFPDIYPFH